jgi:DNA-binding NarL/FixJ family response regulator
LNLLETARPGEPERGCHRDSGTLRVLIVSGVRLYREGLALALATTPRIEARTSAPEGAVEAAATFASDVVLMDSHSVVGTDLVERLSERAPARRVVAFGLADDDEDLVVGCAEAGVAGFVGKDASADDLRAVVESAARGEVRCSPRVAGLLVRQVCGRAAERRARNREIGLTAQELKVLRLMADGRSNKEIAHCLGIEVSTVKRHGHHLFCKIAVTSRGQAVAWLRASTGPNGRN